MQIETKFNIGDKVKVEDFRGKVICITEVSEITQAGNVRTKAYKGLFYPDGTERRRSLTWSDKRYIRKLENQEEPKNG